MTDPRMLTAAILAAVWLWRLLRPVRVVGEFEQRAVENGRKKRGYR